MELNERADIDTSQIEDGRGSGGGGGIGGLPIGGGGIAGVVVTLIIAVLLTKVLGDLDNVNVTLVPYRLRRRGGLTPVPFNNTETAATRSTGRRSSP